MLIVGFGNTLGSFSSGWLLERFGRTATIAAATAGLVLMYCLLPFVPFLWQVQAVLFLCYGLTGILVPVMMGLLQSLAPEARGTISSFANASMYTGALCGSALAGLLYAHIGFFGVSLFTALNILLSLFLFLRIGSAKQVAAQM
ncbi:MFS transporter, partial [Microbacteriaceae bacterium K1510]|nr:MFS transporter [Microbacteriaceae bacterium K1510]